MTTEAQTQDTFGIVDMSKFVYKNPFPPSVMLADPNGSLIQINFPGSDRAMVKIKYDGSMEYAEGYEPDAAARVFWSAMVAILPGYLRQPTA